jgi:hypothetical protein
VLKFNSPALSLALLLSLPLSALSLDLSSVVGGFANPPEDCRIMMRWWWFGPAVTHQELARELRVMKAAGIGGVEIQPVYPLELDDPKTGFHNQTYLSKEFLDAVRFTSDTAHRLGLRVDITLGSGWPYGGPDTPVTEASARLRIEKSELPPALENGESIIAYFPEQKTYFIASRTGQQVKRPSIGAEGFVLDHYSRAAIEHHLNAVGERLMQAFGPHPPYSVFSDSLEVYSADWTPDFFAEFQKRRGYDLKPHLLALVDDNVEGAAAIRHDWGQTLTELAEDNYLTPIEKWAHEHHTLFRSQTYGEPPVRLYSGAIPDLAEGEAGPQWRKFNTARWAASINHLMGRPVTSTETFTWLHAPSFRATPLDMKAEADLHFIEGVNQLICHGWPYSPPSAGEPGWRFYASAAFNDHNPWFMVMPDIAKYLQRISYLMRQGQPVNDIAIYVPTDEIWSSFKPGHTSIDRVMDQRLGPTLIPRILNAGYTFDYVDDLSLEKSTIPYRVLVLPNVERPSAATLAKLRKFVDAGGKVVATREDETILGEKLHSLCPPDLEVSTEAAPVIGFAHRKLSEADIYFVVNTSNTEVKTPAKFRANGANPQEWNAFTGHSDFFDPSYLALAPYESKVIVFGAGMRRKWPVQTTEASLDISSNWEVMFEGLHKTVSMPKLADWTTGAETKFYSGRADYEKTIEIPPDFLGSSPVLLDFGQGEKVASPAPNAPGMRALLESPVRECALVYVNGNLVGPVWHPPYQLDVTQYLRSGSNKLKIVVANLAINEMAASALPTYKLLNARYGERFVPQGFENLHPLPAGLLGPVSLLRK